MNPSFILYNFYATTAIRIPGIFSFAARLSRGIVLGHDVPESERIDEVLGSLSVQRGGDAIAQRIVLVGPNAFGRFGGSELVLSVVGVGPGAATLGLGDQVAVGVVGVEFARIGAESELSAIDREALDRIDLLSVVEHELGHVLGLQDLDALNSGLMSKTLGVETRRVPTNKEVDAVFASDEL